MSFDLDWLEKEPWLSMRQHAEENCEPGEPCATCRPNYVRIRDAILSANRALLHITRVAGDGVRIGKASRIRKAVDDAHKRLEAAMAVLQELAREAPHED